MKCTDARPLLDLLCDGALEVKDSALVLDHLKTCEECQDEWNGLEQLHSSFRDAKDKPPMPAGLMEKISGKLVDDERSKRKPVFVSIMAIAATFLLFGFLFMSWTYQTNNTTTATKVASADTLVEDLVAEETLEPVTDRKELAKKVGYDLKYVRLPQWQMNKSGVYKSQATTPIARFDFVRKGQSGDQRLSCYQAQQGMIRANTANLKNLGDKHVLFGNHGKFQFALWTQNGRDYLFVTALSQPQLEEIVRDA
jgi:Putative zinc-finger